MVPSENKYLFNGKELQEEQLGGVNLDWYDYMVNFFIPNRRYFHIFMDGKINCKVMTEIKKILQLSVEERIHLVQTIWDSIAVDTEATQVSKEHKLILDKRLKAHKDNPIEVVKWNDVKKAAKNIL